MSVLAPRIFPLLEHCEREQGEREGVGGGAGQDPEQEREVLPAHLPPAGWGLPLRFCPAPPGTTY